MEADASNGQKLGAVERTARLNFCCSGRIDWIRPTSVGELILSGTPCIYDATSWVSVCNRVSISVRGSDEGAGGRRFIAARVSEMDCMSSA